VSGALTLALVLPLLLVLRGSGVPVAAGTLYISVFLIFLIMQNACAIMMVPFETHNLSTCRYELYRLSPADSVLMRQSNRGYNQLGAVYVLVVTVDILFFLVLLPSGSGLVALFVVSLLLLELVYTALGNLLPRIMLGHVIRARKEEEMAVLQRQLNEILPRIREVTELTEAEHIEMKRLREAQDALCNSPDTLLSLGALFRTAFALFLSVLTVLATVFALEWLGALMSRFAR
jgi:hypothetical protein